MPLLWMSCHSTAFQPSLPSLLSSSSLTTAAAGLPEPEMGCIWHLFWQEVRVTGGTREGCQNLVSHSLAWVNMPWGNTVSVQGLGLGQGLRFLLKGKSTQGVQTFLMSSLSWNSGFGLRTCSPLSPWSGLPKRNQPDWAAPTCLSQTLPWETARPPHNLWQEAERTPSTKLKLLEWI